MWSGRVRAWKASDKTAQAFAEGQGFEASTLRYWASRLRRLPPPPPSPAPRTSVRLARVVRTESPGPRSDAIVVEVGLARVSVRAGFDRATLIAVLEVLTEHGRAR